MNRPPPIQKSEHRPRAVRSQRLYAFRRSLAVAQYLLCLVCITAMPLSGADPQFTDFGDVSSAPTAPAPQNARDAFNAGTRKLKDGKLREAESILQNSVNRQDPDIQPLALYNLGLTRVNEGSAELKKSPDAARSSADGRAAAGRAQGAVDRAKAALTEGEVDKMLAAYVSGRGVQRDVNSAQKAVRKALQLHGSTLRKWQRALGDFKSAAELNPADSKAAENARTVEHSIAKLVDSIREMQQAAAAMSAGKDELKQALQQLKGRIPASMLPPESGGDDGEDEDGPDGTLPKIPPGFEESAGREGTEMHLTPEQAGQMLDSYSLDGNRRLPMGQGEPGKTPDRKRRNW